MKPEEIHIVYFIGIGGIGMSALARWFNLNGSSVSGYDKTPSPLTDTLAKEGISIHFEDNIENIPSEILSKKEGTLVVYTPAIPKEHLEFNYLKTKGYQIMKRSEVLGLITKNAFTVAVAGTHGKTTTSSIIAHILKASERNCAAFLGGITVNYKSNLIVNKKDTGQYIIVVEADEYDRSFLTLYPNIAVITSADADHLDIYGDKDYMYDSFKAFINKIAKNGKLFINETIADSLLVNNTSDFEINRYSLEKGTLYAKNVKIENGNSVFDLVAGEHTFQGWSLKMPGYHNLENAIAAIGVAFSLGIPEEEIKRAIISYDGVTRRFEYIIKREDVIFIDDYAHHPVEIKSFLESVKSIYPDKKITAIFQPHLYSRTRDFANGFAKSLSLAEEVYLMEIYPARELPIEGITSEIIYKNIQSKYKEMCTKENLLDKIRGSNIEVLVTIGAGDIDRFIDPLKDLLSENYHVE